MSAIGINYLGNKDASRCGEAFSELLQRSLDHLEFTDNLLHRNDRNSKFVSQTAKRELVQIQAQTLGVVGAKILACSGTHFDMEGFEGNVTMIPIPTWRVASKNAAFLDELANVSERHSLWLSDMLRVWQQ